MLPTRFFTLNSLPGGGMPAQSSPTRSARMVTLPRRSSWSGQSSSYKRHLSLKPEDGMLATTHSSSHSGVSDRRMVRVRNTRSGSSLCRFGNDVERVALRKGSEAPVPKSAVGRLVARWKMKRIVYQGGASGRGVGSKPPGGLAFCISLSFRSFILDITVLRRGTGPFPSSTLSASARV